MNHPWTLIFFKTVSASSGSISGTGSHSNNAVFCNPMCNIMESVCCIMESAVQYYGIRGLCYGICFSVLWNLLWYIIELNSLQRICQKSLTELLRPISKSCRKEFKAIGHINKLKFIFSGDMSEDWKVSLRCWWKNAQKLCHYSMVDGVFFLKYKVNLWV